MSLTRAEISAGIAAANFLYSPGDLRRYGTNTFPGVTDMTSALQAAVKQSVQDEADRASVYLPGERIRITGTASETLINGITIRGEGIGRTFIVKDGDSPLLSLTMDSSYLNHASISGFSVCPLGPYSANGIDITGGGSIPSITMRDVMFITSGGNRFAKFIRGMNVGETFFDRVFVYGSNPSSGIAISIENNSDLVGSSATVHRFFGVSIYGVEYGVAFQNNKSPGIEGVEFSHCDIVAQRGVLYSNSVPEGSYYAPQITWLGGHINASVRNFDVSYVSQLFIKGANLYNSGSAEFLLLNNVSDFDVSHNKLINVGSGNVSGITYSLASGPIDMGRISANDFKLGASTGACINIAGVNNIGSGRINDNTKIGGSAFINVLSGTMPAGLLVYNN